MSVSLFVFLERSNLPSTPRWQTAIDRLSIDLQLDVAIDTADHAGYWPVECNGSGSGFEYFGSIAEVFGATPPADLEGREAVVNFVTHSDMSELRYAMFAASALAVASGGRVVDGETGDLISADALLDQARAVPE